MFDIESAYVDTAAIDEGKWTPLGADFPGVEILARGMSSEGAKALYDKLRRDAPRSDRLSNGLLSDEANERIVRQVIVEKCLIDWKGLSSAGKPLPYSRTTAEGILTERRARKIATAIVNAISAIDNGTADATNSSIEDVEKNS